MTPPTPPAPVRKLRVASVQFECAPGDKEAATKADRLANGVPLQPDTWESILQTARRLGINDQA